MILHAEHAIDQGIPRIIVASSDTDVMILLLHFIAPIAEETWMAAKKEKKMYPLHEIVKGIPPIVLSNLPGFHALTGCDTTSSFRKFGKKTCWATYLQHAELLTHVGRDEDSKQAEMFVLYIYKNPNSNNLNAARYEIFTKGKKEVEKLPPTQDAFQLHLVRANHQANIWYQATTPLMEIENPADTLGWSKTGVNQLEIIWTRLTPVSQSTFEIFTCGCTTQCGTSRCTCAKSGLVCIPACGCDARNCFNPNSLPMPQ